MRSLNNRQRHVRLSIVFASLFCSGFCRSVHLWHIVLAIKWWRRCSLLRDFRNGKPTRPVVDCGYSASADAVGQAARAVQHYPQVCRVRCDLEFIPLTLTVVFVAPSLPFTCCDTWQANSPHRSQPALAAKICQTFSPEELLDGLSTAPLRQM